MCQYERQLSRILVAMLVSSSALEITAILSEYCREKKIGTQVYSFDSCGSTNTEALNLAKNGAPHGTVVSSLSQQFGRGRRGKSWESEIGNVAFSLILRPNIAVSQAYRFTFIAALCVVRALEKFGLNASIKWPNDVLLYNKEGQKRKVCGILVESSSSSTMLNSLIIGIGINVASSPQGDNFPIAPGHLQQWADVSSLDLIKALIDELDRLVDMAQSDEQFAILLAAYRRQCVSINESIKFNAHSIEVQGKAVDVLFDGALLVELSNGQTKKIYSVA